jgi:hypothetical protein
MKRNNKTFKDQKKYNVKQNGELRQPKNKNKMTARYSVEYDDAQEALSNLTYVGNFRF